MREKRVEKRSTVGWGHRGGEQTAGHANSLLKVDFGGKTREGKKILCFFGLDGVRSSSDRSPRLHVRKALRGGTREVGI